MTWTPEPEDDWQDAVEDALATAWGRAAVHDANPFWLRYVIHDEWTDMWGNHKMQVTGWNTDWFTQPKKGRWVSDDR